MHEHHDTAISNCLHHTFKSREEFNNTVKLRDLNEVWNKPTMQITNLEKWTLNVIDSVNDNETWNIVTERWTTLVNWRKINDQSLDKLTIYDMC